MAQTLAIDIRNVTKYFRSMSRKVLALDNINLQVRSGDIFGFLGPNGAGKTTLIKIMMGMLHPDSGEARIMGAIPSERDSRRRLGYLPERPYYHDFLTGEEFLQFHGRLFNMSDDEIKKRIPEVLDMVGLTKGRHLSLRGFSKGMLQRIGLAQALLHDPDVLVLDEPMSGLDPLGRREVRDLIKEIAKTGKTIFFSTHIVNDVEVICSNVGFVNHGKLKAIDNLDEALGRTIKSVEVRFTLPDSVKATPELLKGATQRVDGWFLDVPVKEDEPFDAVDRRVNEVITSIVAQKGFVRSVLPRKGNLEELFFEEKS